MDDRWPRIVIWLNPGVVPPLTLTGPLKGDWYALMGGFASAFATPTGMGDHDALKAAGALVEEEWQWSWLRYTHRAGRK